MHDVSFGNLQPAGVSVARRWSEAGPILLAPIHNHRIMVHASMATWSICRETGTRHLRQSGDIDIVPAGEAGGYDAVAPCEALEIRLSPSIVARVASEIGRKDAQSGLATRHILKDERIGHLARALESERQAGTPGGQLYADSIGVALAVQLLGLAGTAPAPRRGLSAAQLKRVFDFVEARLDQPLTIEALAREAGASASHLRHWFKAATGMSVHRYVVRRRVERARSLLRQGTLSASEVALAAGFAHQSHMAHWMRRELGTTPRGLR